MSVTLGTSGSLVLDSGSNLIGQVALSDGTNVIGVSGHPMVVDGTVTATLTANSTVTDVPAISGGWSSIVAQALSNVAVTVKSTAGQLGGYSIFNPNSATEYVFFYNTASSTIGSTSNLLYQIGIPGGAAANVEFGKGIAFSTCIYVAASSSPTSSVAPTAGLIVTTLYK
jgi:hypothetical protein